MRVINVNSITGNLLSAAEGLIVHGCNAQGVMNSGVAKEIRARYPQAFADYRRVYEEKGLRLGQIVWTKISESPKLAIANAITQEFYGRDPNVLYANYQAIEHVFAKVGQLARQHGLHVHYPLIGAGLGNGDWDIIKPLIDKGLEGVEHTLWLYTPPTPLSRPGR